jgi:hypothetical protein
MMAKALSYKLALLGCVSSCLMGAAHANVQSNDDIVLTLISDDYRDVACEAKSREYIYEITNNDDGDEAIIQKMGVHRDDDFDRDLVTVSQFLSNCTNDGLAGTNAQQTLLPGETCQITVTVTPKAVDCGNDDEYPPQGDVDRELYVNVYGQESVTDDIDFSVSYFGSGDSISLFGTNLCNDETSNCDDDNLYYADLDAANLAMACGTPGGMFGGVTTRTNHDVAAFGESSFIGAGICANTNNVNSQDNYHYDDNFITENAEADIHAGYKKFETLALELDNSTFLPVDYFDDPSNPPVITSGIYRFSGNFNTPVVISQDVTIASGATPAIFIIDPNFHFDDDKNAFIVEEGVNFTLSPGALPPIWLVEGNVEIDTALNKSNQQGNAGNIPAPGFCVNRPNLVSFVGDLVATGSIEVENEPKNGCVDGVGKITGQLLSKHSNVALYGLYDITTP